MQIRYVLASCFIAATAFAQAPETPPPPEAPPAPEAPAAPVTPPPTVSTPPSSAPIVEPVHNGKPDLGPIAGYNGSFFLRDPHDWFVLYPKGRLQIDWYNFLNRGDPPNPSVNAPNSAGDNRPKDTLFVRRARIEVQGTMIRHFDYMIAAEFTTTPAAGANGILSDAFVIADYLSFLKLQVGQFDLPFSLENRTSDKYLDFMERGASVRYLAVPANKDFGGMAWGWLPKNVAYYSIGVFNGAGQNFKNQDNYGAIIGRAFVAPVAWMPLAEKYKWLKDITVGGSFWWQHLTNIGAQIAGSSGGTQNDLAGMSTPGGFSFFSSNYNVTTDANGNNVREHLVPGGDTFKWAVEARVPIWKFGLQAELMHTSQDLLSYYDSVNVPTVTVDPATGKQTSSKWNGAPFKRSAPSGGGSIDGYGGYIEAFAWILGDVNFIETPGLEPMPRMKKWALQKEPKWGLRVLARYEQVNMNITGLQGVIDPKSGTTTADPGVGNYRLHTIGLGIDAWGTKHVRLTANYFCNIIDGDTGTVAPNITKNLYYNGPSPNRAPEHELLFRVGINL
jgi:hypothetical protein